MPKIEITNIDYFLDSMLIISPFLFIIFLCFFINKKWKQKIKDFFKRK